MKRKSSLTNLLEFFDDVTGKIDKEEPVGCIFRYLEGFELGPTQELGL